MWHYGCMRKRADRTVSDHGGHSGAAVAVVDRRIVRSRADARPVKLGFFNLFWIFVICSVAGLIVETLVSYPIDRMWKDRAGLLFGPFSPIYGVGGVLMTVVLNRFSEKGPVTIFFIAALAGGAFEYVAGWFFEHAFGIVAWSYEGQPFNLGGHTCLGIALCWGVLGLLWAKALLPLAMKAIGHMPQGIRGAATAVAAVFLAVDVVMTLMAFNCWFERQSGEAPESSMQTYFAEHFDDEYMSGRFQTMSIYPDLVKRG